MENKLEAIKLLEFLRPFYLDAAPAKRINEILLQFNHPPALTKRFLNNLNNINKFIIANSSSHRWNELGDTAFVNRDTIISLKTQNFDELTDPGSPEIVVFAEITAAGVQYLNEYYQYKGVLSTIETNKIVERTNKSIRITNRNTRKTNTILKTIFIITAIIAGLGLAVSLYSAIKDSNTQALLKELNRKDSLIQVLNKELILQSKKNP